MPDQAAGEATPLSVARILDLPAPAPASVPSVAQVLDLPVAPEPVKYRAFDDAPAAREAMQANILKAVQGRYPIENQRRRLALENVAWAGADRFSLKEQKRAIMRGESLDRLLEGDWVLYDKETGKEVQRRHSTVAHVPYLTNRGTFIYRGNEYTVGNQMRLKPGVYTRVKENGILEAHVNVRPGTGPSFRIYMEPDTGVFRLGLGQSELKLYPILKAMGVDDRQLEKSWGRELLRRNVEAEDPRAVSRAFSKLIGTLEEEPPEDAEAETEKEAAFGDSRLAHEEGFSGCNGTPVRAGFNQSGDLPAGDGRAASGAHDAGPDQGGFEGGGQVKQAASEAGVRAASKWIAPVFGAAAVPAGVRASLYGYGLAGVAREVRPEVEKTRDIAKDFKRRFGREAMLSYDKFNPLDDTYKQWRKLREAKFLEPYIRAGYEGLTEPVTSRTGAMDVVRRLRQLTGTWKDYQIRHYGAFTTSPREAFRVLAHEGVEETKAQGLKTALDDLLKDYDRLSAEHGPYRGLYRLYNEPWAQVNLANPKSVKKFVEAYGNDALDDARKKQALLFYASKSKLYAPAWYGALTTGSALAGHALGLGGAAAAGYGGYKALAGLVRLLKRGEEETKPALPPELKPEEKKEIEEAVQGPGPVTGLLAGANPFSMKVDVMGVPFKPETRQEELKRVIPAIVGKGLVGAIVVPSMVRSGVELARGLAKQGPYAQIPGRLRAGASGVLLGAAIPVLTLLRALRTGSALRALQAGRKLPVARMKMLAKHLGEAPLRAGGSAQRAIPLLSKGRAISSGLAGKVRSEMFEPNTTILLNALLGGGITGYAGYAAYARGKRLREAFEQVYGKELPPEVAAVIMDPRKMQQLARSRREALRVQRHRETAEKTEARRRLRLEQRQARDSARERS